MSLLHVENLTHHYPGGPTWLQGWSVDMDAGVHLVEGGDGAGKSTLVRLLAGHVAPVSGRLRLNRHWLDDSPAAYRADVFWCDPQSDRLDELGATDYLAHHRQHHRTWEHDALAAYVDEFGLRPHLHKPLYALSTGTRRKLRLAAALSSGALLTLMDDPFSALDQASIRAVGDALADEAARASRVIVVAHPGGPDSLPRVPLRSHQVLAPR